MGAWLTKDGCPASRGALGTTYLVDDHKGQSTNWMVGSAFRLTPRSHFRTDDTNCSGVLILLIAISVQRVGGHRAGL